MPDEGLKIFLKNDTDEKIKELQKSYDNLYAKYVELRDIMDGGIEYINIQKDTIKGHNIEPRTITDEEIEDAAIIASKIASDAVTEIKLAAEAVTEDKIAANAVVADKIYAGAVGTEKLAALAITADKIAASAITTVKLDALAITGDKIAAGTITASKYNELRNTYVFNGDDSLDATFPFELDFEIVSEMTAINSVKLSFRISQFRAYSVAGAAAGTPSGGGSTSGAGGGQTSSSSNIQAAVYTQVNSLEVGGVANVLQSAGGMYRMIADAAGVTAIMNHTHTVSNHQHTTPNHTHPNHTHDAVYGIYEDSQSPTIHYHIDNGAGYGGASSNFTTDQLDINITASISGTGFKRIKFDSNARCRIRAWVLCKVDLSA